MIVHKAQHIMGSLLDLLFPPRCVGCKSSGRILCPACIAKIQPLKSPLCAHCGMPTTPGLSCQRCSYHHLRLSGLHSVSAYQEPLRSFIHAFKYEGKTRLAAPLGALLAHKYRASGLHVDMIIPVPLHSERLRQRGYNQAQLLAVACATELGIPQSAALLVRGRPTAAQVHLSPADRQQNVAGAFLLAPAYARVLRGRKILLIDDVCTTGATLEACAAPLFAAGASGVWGLVLARPL